LQRPKKREGWLCEVVGALGKYFPMLSLFLQGMKGNIFGWFLFLFPTLKVPIEIEIMIEKKIATS